MYILNESVMNGTVTVSITSTIIKANTYAEAKKKVKARAKKNKVQITNESTSPNGWSFTIPQSGSLGLMGFLSNKKVSVI